MSDRVEMLEAALDLLDEGVVVLDSQSNVSFWNKAASCVTGHQRDELIWQPCPDDLYRVNEEHRTRVNTRIGTCGQGGWPRAANEWGRAVAEYPDQQVGLDDEPEHEELLRSPTLVSMSHKLGHTVPAMLRKVALRDGAGERMGTALMFYPVDEVDALPHGESGEDVGIERSQADMEDRLEAAHHQWVTAHMPFGLLWVTVDQAQSMRTTHGRDACEAMLRTVEQTLLRQMKPTEVIGRWGNNEFLVLTHERTTELLADHGRRLAGLARTADFRWWGDRLGLTVSIGASHATEGETLQSLLHRARQGMHASGYAGGNQVTEARGI